MRTINRNHLTALALCFVGAACAASLRPGVHAPELDASKWIKGDQVSLADKPADQVTIVEFWAPW